MYIYVCVCMCVGGWVSVCLPACMRVNVYMCTQSYVRDPYENRKTMRISNAI